MDAQKRALEDASGLQSRISELQERERALIQRENSLNEQIRDFRSYSNEYAYGNANAYGYTQPAQYLAPTTSPYGSESLRDRAQTDGIRLNTAGNMRSFNVKPHEPTAVVTPTQATKATTGKGYYNVGLTLFKSAFIVFCIIAFESLAVYFVRNYLGVSALYPVLGFTAGFIAFITCSILYACGYKQRTRRKKHPSYLLTTAVIFVTAVIAISMIAVYCKAQISEPSELLAYVLIPVGYFANILIFAAFYYIFSRSNKH